LQEENPDMKLYIKQKVFSIGAKFNITDENGEEKYSVQGEVISLGKKLHIYKNGEEVALVQQKLLSFLPRFFILVGGEKKIEIVREFTLLKPRYNIIGKDWIVDGDYLSHDYVISSQGNEIARIHKVWMSWGDSFELDILDTDDEVSLIAVILVIDAVMDAGNKNTNTTTLNFH
jgi:uncharacterized protein YxjI